MKTPTTLIIMDGLGLGEPTADNAVHSANTPYLNYLQQSACQSKLAADSLNVGLPEGQMGNSEVGHTNIGAGRVVFQDLPRINQSITDHSFYQNTAYLSAMQRCKDTGSALHIMGLLSDGGVHSHINHLYALLQMAKDQQVETVYIHAFLDGRDVSPTSGITYVSDCLSTCESLGIGTLATITGRYYAMDRDNRWERIQVAYDAITSGIGLETTDPIQAIQTSYENDVTDEFMAPIICTQKAKVHAGDSIIFFNYRPDRAREITRCFIDSELTSINRKQGFLPVHFVCTTEYDANFSSVQLAYPRIDLQNTLGQFISNLGLTQLRIAETEKYAHVTFFFNGGREEPYPNEDRVLIPSPKVATYDLKPEMSAYEVAAEAESRIKSGAYDVIILNFANCDMVGHTGSFEAAVQATITVDACVKTVVNATTEMGGISLITADHGNAEQMLDENNQPMTSHTLNPVPFYIVGADVKLRDGRLADIAPTILDLMGLEKPAEMQGSTLIIT